MEVITAIGGPCYPWVSGTGNAFLNESTSYRVLTGLHGWLSVGRAFPCSHPGTSHVHTEPELTRDSR